jgi:hypothetical protein
VPSSTGLLATYTILLLAYIARANAMFLGRGEEEWMTTVVAGGEGLTAVGTREERGEG